MECTPAQRIIANNAAIFTPNWIHGSGLSPAQKIPFPYEKNGNNSTPTTPNIVLKEAMIFMKNESYSFLGKNYPYLL